MDRTTLARRLQPRGVVALCAVTLAIWLNRIPLAWTNDEDTVAEKLVWSVPITLFVVAAFVVLVALLRGSNPSAGWLARTVGAFAVGTVAYWAVRTPMILLGDWSAGFKVVHAVLALASVAAAVAALRSLRGTLVAAAPRRAGTTPVAR